MNNNFWFLISLIVTVLLAPYILVEPLNSCCISQVGQKQELNSIPASDETARVTIPVDGQKTFAVVASNVDKVSLIDEDAQTPLAQIQAKQYDYGNIEALALTKSGWLWIDGSQIDYMARLDLKRMPPTLSQPVALPDLYEQPCSFWARFWEECRRVQGVYSTTLERAFISGHHPTLFGWSSLVSLEMGDSEAKPLPAKLQGTRFLVEVPKLGGVLFRGCTDEAFFYDGVTVTTLLVQSSEQSAQSPESNWYVHSTLHGERTFLTNIAFSDTPPFLLELKHGPTQMPISIPNELADSWIELFTLPDNPRLWGVMRYGLFAEVEGRLQAVMTVPMPSSIDGPASIHQAADGTISFVVKNASTGSSTKYFLRRISPTDRCQANLNVDKLIEPKWVLCDH